MQNHLHKAKTSIRRGALYVVATPIGNLSDISLRALAVLESADVICAEDTRVSAKLLAAYGLRVPLLSVREHNEKEMAHKIIDRIRAGEVVVQISDAGTPAICDPGSRLVQTVRQADLPVYAVPGACAVVAAFSVAGIVSEDFYFGGFLPVKKGERQQRLQALYAHGGTVIVYETPHRIIDTLRAMTALPVRTVSLVRELTKTFETLLTDTPERLLEIVQNDSNQSKGEMVLLIHPQTDGSREQTTAEGDKILRVLAAHLPTKQAAQIAAEICGGSKSTLYGQILQLKDSA